MKNLISSLKKATHLVSMLLVIFITSCRKPATSPNPTPPPTGGGGTPPPIIKPSYFDLKADDTTVIYGGSAKITVSTDGDSVTRDMTGELVNGSITIYNIKGDSIISFTSKSGDKTITKSIKLYSLSPNTSQMLGYNQLHMTFNKACVDGAQLINPIVWSVDGYIDPTYWIRFLKNNLTQMSIGSGHWYWYNSNEESINFGANDVWHVILFADGFDRWQISGGFYTLQKFRK